MDPKDLHISSFTYDLPANRIALHPLPERDSSRLLIHRNGKMTEDIYRNLAHHIPAGSFLVFNNTRVLEARMHFVKESGGVIEIFILEPADISGSISSALQQRGSIECNCLIGGASKWKKNYVPEMTIDGDDGPLKIRAYILARLQDHFRIRLEWEPASETFASILHKAGQIPIPPYLHRVPDDGDVQRYQTVYAAEQGSVAAPTAGLHFTEAVFSELAARNIEKAFVTLHVGAGTFRPVKAERMSGHEMHSEYIEVDRSFLEHLHMQSGPVYAVGTTSLRTLESLYWMGKKIIQNPDLKAEDLMVSQWEPYDAFTGEEADPKKAIAHLLGWMDRSQTDKLITRTQVMIAPGYRFRVVKGLVTNFHQPQSTLLLLVAAMIGDEWEKMYAHALAEGVRFLSYGDGCLIETT